MAFRPITNEEDLRRVAKTRYGKDLQGALRRAMVTTATTAAIGKDINGMCKAAYSLERGRSHDAMLFTLNSAPAP